MNSDKIELVLDIETAAFDFESFSDSQKEFLMRYAEKEKDEDARAEKIEEVYRYLNSYPLTAKAIVIGLMNIHTGNRYILYESDVPEERKNETKKITYHGMSEKAMLVQFWNFAKKADRLITFNGRQFDVPFLMFRSAVHGVRPTRNFIKSRYDTTTHVDLLDQFTFYGAVRKFNLDFYCRAFDIKSPKEDGITGMEVKTLYDAGKIDEIAIYCGEDVLATAKLFEIWNKYLNVR